MIVLIDNYDSFSYNLYQLIGSLHSDIQVVRNDTITVEQIKNMRPQAIVLSPGPGRPAGAGICLQLIKQLKRDFPFLGICLGHQAICEAFGSTVSYAKEIMHGKQSLIKVDNTHPLFKGLPSSIEAGRYHSLACDPAALSEELMVTAQTADGEIMAVAHREANIFGLQFHPESILTPDGKTIMKNFLTIVNGITGI